MYKIFLMACFIILNSIPLYIQAQGIKQKITKSIYTATQSYNSLNPLYTKPMVAKKKNNSISLFNMVDPMLLTLGQFLLGGGAIIPLAKQIYLDLELQAGIGLDFEIDIKSQISVKIVL